MAAKPHRKKGGKKGGKKSAKGGKGGDGRRNPKAFIHQSSRKARIQQSRSSEKEQRKLHAPLLDRSTDEPPPQVVLVQGPPKVGKSTLIKCLVRHYARQTPPVVGGPITVVASKKRRITFVECPHDLNGMIDAAKFADLVLLLIDGNFGFEMETFEFLNILQVHGFPKVMGVLTHLDAFQNDAKKLRKTKKQLKSRFSAEIYEGAKLFYLNGIRYGKYLHHEIRNLARFISVMKLRPLSWRTTHPYVVVDRFEDVTPQENVNQDAKCGRDVLLYGFLRGYNLRREARVHVAGVGDFSMEELDGLIDPCPLPDTIKKRGLNEKERIIYAPMNDIGGFMYDKDAVYVDIPDWKVQYSKSNRSIAGEVGSQGQDRVGEDMVRVLQGTQKTVDEKLNESRVQVFKGGSGLSGEIETSGKLHFVNGDNRNIEQGKDESDLSEEGGEESEVSSSSGDDGTDGKQPSDKEFLSDDEADSSDDDSGLDGAAEASGSQQFCLVKDSGRVRRKVVFANNGRDAEQDCGTQSNEDDETSSSDASEGLGAATKWKSGMLARASRLFGRSGPDLQTAVYGRKATAPEEGETDDEASSGDEDELFRPVGSESSRSRWKDGQETKNGLDSSRVVFPLDIVQKWEGEGSAEVLRNRFVTGNWEEGRRRSEARPGTSDGSDYGTSDGGDVYGDFEDVETGEMFGGPKDAVTEMAQRAIHEVEMERKKEKAAKKAVFDVEYDEEGAGGVADAPVGGAQECDSGEKEPTFYHTVKQEMMEKLAHTRSALDALDPVQRVALEGFRPGTYIRMRLSGVPAEMVEEFDSERPLLVGGMGPGEDKLGFMRLRFKKHRWAPRVLKTRDPLVFSVGWRRFQSLPTYAIEDHNRRLRMLKYTPEHMHCVAVAWGPLCPPNTGILGIQNLSSDLQNWRISGTGVVTELKADFQVMKKLKLVGHPFKVHKNTAFISGMFNSSLEVSKFEGASVKTVSGIRGTIKKAVREGSSQGAPDGTFRATFEDKLLASDIIFLRAWVTVELPRYCNPVTNMMYRQETVGRKILRASAAHEEAAGDIIESKETEELAPNFSAAPNFEGERIGYVFKTGDLGLGYYRDSHYVTPARRSDAEGASSAAWKGMRTVAELRRLLGVGVVTDQDSAYRPIERAPRIFPSMKIPKTILKNLPYKSRVKVMALNGQKDKTPIIQTDEEKKLRGTIRQLRAIRSERDKKRKLQKERQRQKLEKRQAEEEAWRAKYNREERKKRYRAEAEKEQAKAKRGKMQRR